MPFDPNSYGTDTASVGFDPSKYGKEDAPKVSFYTTSGAIADRGAATLIGLSQEDEDKLHNAKAGETIKLTGYGDVKAAGNDTFQVNKILPKPIDAGGPLATAGQHFLEGLPGAAGAAVGMGAVQPVSDSLRGIPRVGPLLAGGTTILGGIVGSLTGSKAKEAISPDSPEFQALLQAGQEQNPKSAIVGSLGAQAPFFGVTGANLTQRAIMAGIGGGVQAAQEGIPAIITGKPIEPGLPSRMGVAALGGAIFANPTKLGEGLMAAGSAIPGSVGLGNAVRSVVPKPVSITEKLGDVKAGDPIPQVVQSANEIALGPGEDLSGFQPTQVNPPLNLPQDPALQRQLLDQEIRSNALDTINAQVNTGREQAPVAKDTILAEIARRANEKQQQDLSQIQVNDALGVRRTAPPAAADTVLAERAAQGADQIPPPDIQAQRAAEFNKRVSDVQANLANEGVDLDRQTAVKLARITDPAEFNAARQQLIDSVNPKIPDVPASGPIKSLSELNPSNFPLTERTGLTGQSRRSNGEIPREIGQGDIINNAQRIRDEQFSRRMELAPQAPTLPEVAPKKKVAAPAEFAGVQEGVPEAGIPSFELYNLTKDIPGHPEGSTVSRQTLEDAGFEVPVRDATPTTTPRTSKEAGFINPGLQGHLAATTIGSAIGYQFGDTPEEKLKNAAIGAAIANGGIAAPRLAAKLFQENPEMLGKILTQAHDYINRPAYKSPEIVPSAPEAPKPADQAVAPVAAPEPKDIPFPAKPPVRPEVSDEKRASEGYRKEVNADILKTFNRATNSPSVDIEHQKVIKQLVKDTVGVDPKQLKKLTEEDIPINALEQLRDQIRMQEYLGRMKVRDMRVRDDAERVIVQGEMASSPSQSLDNDTPSDRSVGVTPSLPARAAQEFANKFKDGIQSLVNGGRALLHNDVIADMLDGNSNYNGFIIKNLVGRFDKAYNARQLVLNEWKAPLREIINKYKLDKASLERIGIYAQARQEGGIEALKASGLSESQISELSKLTPQEKEYYDAARKILDEKVLPGISNIMHNEYNVDVKPVENYWPRQRDWDNYTSLPESPESKFGGGETAGLDAIAKGLQEDAYTPRSTKTNQGMTIERTPGAKQPIRLNAGEVMDAHLNAAAHLITHQHDLKIMGRIVRDPAFREKYGSFGHEWASNYLDTIARDGGFAGARKIGWLDYLRNNLSSAILGWRLIAQVKHLPNAGIAVAEVGLNHATNGLHDMFTQEGKDFIAKNFREVHERFAAEPTIGESAEGSKGVIRELLNKTWIGNPRNAFLPERAIDAVVGRSTVIAAYRKALEARGIDPDTYATHPFDQEAGRQALITARKVITSPLYKDLPQAISRANLTGGNKSLAKTLFQFQNIMLRQAGYVKHDLVDLGISQKDWGKFGAAALGFLAMLGGETGLIEINKQLLNKKKKNDADHSFAEEMALEAVKRVPGVGNITTAVSRGETGIPVVDTITHAAHSGYQLATNKNDMGARLSPKQRTADQIDLATGIAGPLTGIPGISTLGQIVKNNSN